MLDSGRLPNKRIKNLIVSIYVMISFTNQDEVMSPTARPLYLDNASH